MLNEKIITIEEGRDAGKAFAVKEMPASKLEKWSARALLALFNGQVPAEILNVSRVSNSAALVQSALSGLGSLNWATVEPLYDELLTCVARVPDPTSPGTRVQLNAANVDAHVQDMGTLLRLRAAVLEVCFDFFGREGGLYSRIREAVAPRSSGTTRPSRPA